MFSSREGFSKMLTAFNLDEICEDYVDYDLFERLETVIKRLQNDDLGVKRKSEKKLLGSVQYDTFTGAELIRSLQRLLETDTAEALNIGNQLLHYGYIYPSDSNSSQLSIKEDTTHFRFQNTKYWPSQKPDGSEEEYAIFLVKKKMLAKGKNGLHQNEVAYFGKLLEVFGSRWGTVMKTAEEQYRVLKVKKKAERSLIEREEEAFWRVHRPREDDVNVFDAGYKKYSNRFSRKDLRTLSTVQTEVNSLKDKAQLIRIPTSVAANNLICHCDMHEKVDLLLDPKSEVASSSRWLKDFAPRTLALDSLRLEKWKISLNTLLSDPKGIEELDKFLQKEFSEENLRFWLHCEELRYTAKSNIKKSVIRIYRDFMAPGAKFEINVDNKAMQEIRDGIRNPSRFAFDTAQSQIFSLMSTDSYPRFLKSEQYQDLVEKAKNAKVTNARKSNNRLLEAARGFVKRPSLNDILPNNIKPHIKLGRSSSDFPGQSTSTRNLGSSCFYLEATSISMQDRSKSENDLTRLDEGSTPGTPIPTRGGLKPPMLKGLPVLKLSRSVTPTGSPVGSPSYQPPLIWKYSPMSSPKASRKVFNFNKENDKKSNQSPLCMNDLEEKLTAVKTNQDLEESQDLSDWHFQKVPHDFLYLICHCDVHEKVDLLLDPKSEVASSSRWLKDFAPRTLALDSLRLEKWKISLNTLLSDPKGIEELDKFLQKEFSEENPRFWLHCEELRYTAKSNIKKSVIRIYRDFMAPGAKFEINVDNKAMQEIRDGIRNPSRFAFDTAQSQIFSLMSTDSYPRFLKSEQYQDLVEKAKNAKVTNARKSNNRLLEAARGFVKRPSLNDILPNNIKPHIKLGRSSSDFPGQSTSTRNLGSSCFYLEATSISMQDRSKSENDLTRLDEGSTPGTPIPTRGGLKPPMLKGLPVLKLSRSVTPTGSLVGSPSYQPPLIWKYSPMSSPKASRKVFNFNKENDKKSNQSPLCMNDLEEKLTAVKTNQDLEESQDLSDWHFQKVPHDFL